MRIKKYKMMIFDTSFHFCAHALDNCDLMYFLFFFFYSYINLETD